MTVSAGKGGFYACSMFRVTDVHRNGPTPLFPVERVTSSFMWFDALWARRV